MSQKITSTTLATIRTPAEVEVARRSGLLGHLVDCPLRACQESLEPALRPGELERKHPEPEDDHRDSGAWRHEHDDARRGPRPGSREHGAVDAVSLPVPVGARTRSISGGRPPVSS